MTLKEAVLKSLEDINAITSYLAVLNQEVENYCIEKHIPTNEE